MDGPETAFYNNKRGNHFSPVASATWLLPVSIAAPHEHMIYPTFILYTKGCACCRPFINELKHCRHGYTNVLNNHEHTEPCSVCFGPNIVSGTQYYISYHICVCT